jgi:cell division septum initiation protein DivIVA
MTQQTSPQPLRPPPDPFQLATSLVRHARGTLDEIRKTGSDDRQGLAELQAEIERLNEENRRLKERLDQLEKKLV